MTEEAKEKEIIKTEGEEKQDDAEATEEADGVEVDGEEEEEEVAEENQDDVAEENQDDAAEENQDDAAEEDIEDPNNADDEKKKEVKPKDKPKEEKVEHNKSKKGQRKQNGKEEKKPEDEVVDPNFNMDEALQAKIKLSDETESLIFSRGPRYKNLWPINCHLCGQAHILNAGELKKHIESATHCDTLSAETPPDAETFRKPLIQPFCKPLMRLNNPIKISPGEFIEAITPEYYDRLQKVEEFEFRKPAFKGHLEILENEPIHEYNANAPVLGLSYVLKFKSPPSQSSGADDVDYYCLLCRAMCFEEPYQHVTGSVHQMNYIHVHFRNLYKKVKEGLGALKPESVKEKCVRDIFRKVYQKIEELKGKRKIHIILFKDFKMGKKEKFRKFQFRKLVHYDENMVEIPEKDINEWIEKCKNGETIIEPDVPAIKKSKKSSRDTESTSRKRRLPSPRRRDSPPSRKIAREDSDRIDDSPNNWDRYRRMLGAALDDLDREYEEYQEVPENHPDYDSEWRRYWRRRSKELEKDNIDPNYYDFKPEWLDYWADLLKRMHKKEVSKHKFEIKRKLRLPYDKRSPSPIRRRRPRSPVRPRSRPRHRSPSPESSYHARRRYSRSPRNRSRRLEEDEESAFIPAPPEPLGVISVLRQLTVLEDQLGSLGPKALEYLSRAVLFEKERNKPADELMREKEFYVFFVTAKEKLKGQLMANIVERTKVKAANKAVNDLETLLNMFEDFMRQNSGRNLFAGNQPPPMYMGNHPMENVHHPHPNHPSRNVFDPPNNQMMPGRRMPPRQMNDIPPQRNQYNPPPPSMPSNESGDEEEIIEAPPPPRNLFNVQDEARGNQNPPMENAPTRRNPYNQPNDMRNNKRNMNNQMGDSAPNRNPYGGPPNDPRTNRNMGNPQGQHGPYPGGPNIGRPQQPNQFTGGKGGIWQSGASQSFRSNDNFNNVPFGGGGGGGGNNNNNNNNFQAPNYPIGNPGGMGMMTHPGMGGGRGFGGGFRGNHHMNTGNSFRGGMNRGFNN